MWSKLLDSYYCHTQLHLGFSDLSKAENLASSSLQDGATKCHYFHETTRHPKMTPHDCLQQLFFIAESYFTLKMGMFAKK